MRGQLASGRNPGLQASTQSCVPSSDALSTRYQASQGPIQARQINLILLFSIYWDEWVFLPDDHRVECVCSCEACLKKVHPAGQTLVGVYGGGLSLRKAKAASLRHAQGQQAGPSRRLETRVPSCYLFRSRVCGRNGESVGGRYFRRANHPWDRGDNNLPRAKSKDHRASILVRKESMTWRSAQSAGPS